MFIGLKSAGDVNRARLFLLEREWQRKKGIGMIPERMMTLFTSYIGIDYSGAKTTVSGNKGLQVFEAAIDSDPFRVKSPAGKKWNWTRKEIAHWCLEQFKSGDPAEEGTSMLLSMRGDVYVIMLYYPRSSC